MGKQRTTSQVNPAAVAALVVVLVGFAVVDAGLYGGSALARDGQTLPANPLSAPFLLIGARAKWSNWSTIAAVAALVVVLALTVLVLVLVSRRLSRRSRVDHKARLMGSGREIETLTHKSVAASAKRFGMKKGPIGVFIGVSVAGGQKLYADYESVILQIWGPRSGKTTTQVIPAVLDAPGAVLSTSNKPDVVDATRDARSLGGRSVWVFDPQDIAGDRPVWWWNPLSYVTSDEKAASLAKIFGDTGRAPGVKPDPYFDPAARDLISDLFLAAAIGDRQITDVYEWVSQGLASEPLRVLREDGRYLLNAGSLEGKANLAADQKAGVWGSAIEMLQSLKYQSTGPWVNRKGAGDPRPHFDVSNFVRSKDTLYVLSKEGGGSAAALTTALTIAVADAAEEYAMRCKGRRLPVPLILALDEIANVCPWKDLPDKYSHYGSKGIIPIAFLQSWSQGVELWGTAGMEKIWSASAIKVVGSGIGEDPYLRRITSLIGDYTYNTVSESRSRSGLSRSFNPDSGKESIFTPSDLTEMPRGRVIVFRAGSRTTLARTVLWNAGEHNDAVAESLEKNEPNGQPAINKNPWLDAAADH